MIWEFILLWVLFGIAGYILDMYNYNNTHNQPLRFIEYVTYFIIAIVLGFVGFIFILYNMSKLEE